MKVGRAFICRFTQKADEPAWKSYTQDLICDVIWRWRYVGENVHDLSAFCPECDYRIIPNDLGHGPRCQVELNCDHCNRVIGDFPISPPELILRVLREIDRKLWNGLWITDQSSPRAVRDDNNMI